METTGKEAIQPERAVLVAVVRERQEVSQSEEYLDELEFLAETAGRASTSVPASWRR